MEINAEPAGSSRTLAATPAKAADLIEALRQAQALTRSDPTNAASWKILGNSLLLLGRHADAVAALERALELHPDDASALGQVGYAQRAMGLLDDACECWHRALRLDPGCAEFHCQLGRTLRELGHAEAARECFRNALRIEPRNSDAQCRLGEVQLALGAFIEGEIDFITALDPIPDDFEMLLALGCGLRKLGRRKLAAYVLAATTKVCPHTATALSNLAIELVDIGLLAEGESLLRRALTLEPANAALLNNLGQALERRGALSDAADHFTRSLELRPHHALTLRNLANVLFQVGKMDESIAIQRKALKLTPDCPVTRSDILFYLSRTNTPTTELIAEHFAYGARIESPLRRFWPNHTPERNRDRPLRIGFVSADLRSHSLAYFFEPIARALAHSPNLVLYAYSNNGIDDEMTKRLRPAFRKWRSVATLSDVDLALRIASDGIDILVDLSGHTAGNRLPVFARKPAPLQASWIGYPLTTGLDAVDYYIGDGNFLPPGRFDHWFSEKIVRLPATAAFQPSPSRIAPNSLPALARKHLSFASFNHSTKITSATLEVWAEVLRAVPDSRLLIFVSDPATLGLAFKQALAARGIDPDRIDMRDRLPLSEYLLAHHEADICLDTVPYNGGTTSLHALSMGVPTLTLSGNTPPGCVGASLLHAVGLEGFTANTTAELSAKARHWATHLDALAVIRQELPFRLAQAPIGRPELIAASLKRAFRLMWQRWCDGLEPCAINIEIDDLRQS